MRTKWMWFVVGLLFAAALPALAQQESPCVLVPSTGRGLQREALLSSLDLFSYLQTIRFVSSTGTDGMVFVGAAQPIGHIRISPLPVDRGEIKIATSISRFQIDNQPCMGLNLGILDLSTLLYFRDQVGREHLVSRVQIELRNVRVIPAFAGAESILRIQAVTLIDSALAALQSVAESRARIEVIPTGVVVFSHRDRDNKPVAQTLTIWGLDVEVIPIAPSPFPSPPSDGRG